ncbi:MAG: hypothetical protein IT428_21035 [Planctomycetaceae bacterium]|nr:hypothetical protein [Planctomycetaceae bacterium]
MTRFEVPLDRSIFKTMRRSTPDAPQDLPGIIGGVDAQERMVLSHYELRDGLKRLIAEGHIVEVSKHRFCNAEGLALPRNFSGLTNQDHQTAVAEYRRQFDEACRALDEKPEDEGFIWQKLVVRWVTAPGREPTEEDEDGLEALAELIDPVISASGLGEINGFEHSNYGIGLLIFGWPTDDDVDRIYELVAPLFRQSRCPPGSCLVRYYNERDETLESDHVPSNDGAHG